MTVTANEQTILNEFAFIENPQERMGAIVDSVRHLPHFPEDERTPANHVPGCTSKVWLKAVSTDGRWRFESDCDSPLVRALVHLLCRALQETSTQEAAKARITVLDRLGITRNLTPTRINGLAAVRERIAQLVLGAQ